MPFAHNGNTDTGILTPANSSIGSSNTVNNILVSLENRNIELRRPPHIIDGMIRKNIPMVVSKNPGNTIFFNTITIPIQKTVKSQMFCNKEETALPKINASLLAGDK